MKRILLLTIISILNTICLYSQTLPGLAEVDLLKGKVKKIEMWYYYPDADPPSQIVSEYNSLRQRTSKINYYIKEDPHKEYFSYDSIGNLALRIYESNDYSHRYIYEYEYDDKRRIISQLELKDGKPWGGYDSVVYNNENQLIRYLCNRPHLPIQFVIRYLEGNNNEKIKYIESKKQDSDFIDTVEEIRLYNNHGFLTKKKRKTISYITSDGMENVETIHEEEYDYESYKYDKQGNWTERKIYLNWENKGRRFLQKEKRKIEYH